VQELSPTARTRIRRMPHRAVYDRATLHAILDEGIVCHMGFVVGEQPYVIPTAYAREGETLYLHGSSASRSLKTLGSGLTVCVTVTLIDGLVLSRAIFTHSIDYRSVVVLGTAAPVLDPAEKLRVLHALSEQLVPGRWKDVRPPNPKELKATLVLAMPLKEVSVKVRNGPPIDEDEDLDSSAWAGELPMRTEYLDPIDDPRLSPGITAPDYVINYRRPGSKPAEPMVGTNNGSSQSE